VGDDAKRHLDDTTRHVLTDAHRRVVSLMQLHAVAQDNEP